MKFRDSVLIGVSIFALCIMVAWIAFAMFFVITYKDIAWSVVLGVSCVLFLAVTAYLVVLSNKWYYIDSKSISYCAWRKKKYIDKNDIQVIIWIGAGIYFVPNTVDNTLIALLKSKNRFMKSIMLHKEKSIIRISMSDKIEKLLSNYGYEIDLRYD